MKHRNVLNTNGAPAKYFRGDTDFHYQEKPDTLHEKRKHLRKLQKAARRVQKGS